MARNFYVNIEFKNEDLYDSTEYARHNFKSQAVSLFTEQIIKNVKSRATKQIEQKVTRQLVKGALRKKDVILLSVAILYHRIIARTPEDEDYTRRFFYYNSAKHRKDNDSVKKSWLLSFKGGGFYLSSGQIRDKYIEDPNDNEGAIYIYQKLREGVRNRDIPITSLNNVRISNCSPHYKYVEYGGISGGNSYGRVDLNDGIPHKYPHGLINGFSIQAPVGMYRRSIAEFDNILQEASSYLGKTDNFVANYSSEELDKIKTDLHITNDEIRSKRYSVETQKILEEIKKVN